MKITNKLIFIMLTLIFITTNIFTPILAETISGQAIIRFKKDISREEKIKVLDKLGVTDEKLFDEADMAIVNLPDDKSLEEILELIEDNDNVEAVEPIREVKSEEEEKTLRSGTTSGGSNFQFIDGVPPVLTLNGPAYMVIKLGSVYTEEGATAIDNVDGDITSSIMRHGYVDTNAEGIYKLSYEVRDAAGNIAFIQRTVTVVAPELMSERASYSFSGSLGRANMSDLYTLTANGEGDIDVMFTISDNSNGKISGTVKASIKDSTGKVLISKESASSFVLNAENITEGDYTLNVELRSSDASANYSASVLMPEIWYEVFEDEVTPLGVPESKNISVYLIAAILGILLMAVLAVFFIKKPWVKKT